MLLLVLIVSFNIAFSFPAISFPYSIFSHICPKTFQQGFQQAQQTAAYEPYGRLSQYGQGLTGLSGGVASQSYQEPQQPNMLSQSIGTAMGLGGLYGKIFNPTPWST